MSTEAADGRASSSDEREDESGGEQNAAGRKAAGGAILEGKRAKKCVERLFVAVPVVKEKLTIAQGSGDKLGDIPRINFQIAKLKPENLKPLHTILFERPGTMARVRKNLRLFSGFPFDAGSDQYVKRTDKLLKNVYWTNARLKLVCQILDLEKKGVRSEIVDRIMSFLLAPKKSGKPLPIKKKKKQPPKKKTTTVSKKSNVASESKAESKDQDEDELSVNEEEEEEEEQDNNEASEPPSKKRPRAEKTSPQRKRPKKNPDAASQSGDDADVTPGDERLTETVRALLKDADLEKTTMKQICQLVFRAYPGHDLSDRKDFIKGAVKRLIA
ncbi:protein DEK [Corythoichthys intestinalis]|uniref:protein DEK n=1 Tax=Corythoichthys intestinalis TaxID=161448 RepID=UPI0025A5B2FE|nr:protein DEK [Corythoichthys intestinalis]